MKKCKVHQVVFDNPKKYKGCITYAKLIIAEKYHKIEKRRAFRYDSYGITKEEYDYITSRKKAEKIWAWYHFGVNASSDTKHPIYGKTAR